MLTPDQSRAANTLVSLARTVAEEFERGELDGERVAELREAADEVELLRVASGKD